MFAIGDDYWMTTLVLRQPCISEVANSKKLVGSLLSNENCRRTANAHRSYGMSWGVGGFLVSNFLQRVGPAETRKLQERVAAELKTTFASHYTKVISLQEALQPDVLAAYNKRATGEKYLINPNKA